MPIVFPSCSTCPDPNVTSFTPQECVASLPTQLTIAGPNAQLQLTTPAPASGQTVVVQIGLTATATFVFAPGVSVAAAVISGAPPAPLPATSFYTVAPLTSGCNPTTGQVPTA